MGGRGRDHPVGRCTAATATRGSSSSNTTAWRSGWSTKGSARATTSSGTAISISATGSPMRRRRRRRAPIRERPRARTSWPPRSSPIPTDLLARTARILGRADDAARYAQLFSRVKEAFVREYVTTTGRVGENTQTAYAVALQFDLLPEELRAAAAKRLAQDVRQRKHLTTGFLGTPYLCHVLSRYGYLDEAYLLLNREDYPSWLYPVKQGATTIWERWDGQKPDGTFQDVGMNSFNHYAYGAIGDWMYRVMAGIEIDEAAPGYKHILIQPRPGGGFTDVKASHQTPYGKVASAWTRKDGTFDLAVEVPPNTRATVRLPKAQLASVTEGGQPLAGVHRRQRTEAGRRRRRRGDRLRVLPVRLPQPGLMTRTWPLAAASVVPERGARVGAGARRRRPGRRGRRRSHRGRDGRAARHRQPQAASGLAAAERPARRPADGLPCACGLAARMDSPGHGGPLGFRERALRRSIRGLRRASLEAADPLLLVGAGGDDRRQSRRLVEPRLVRDRAPRRPRIGRAPGSPAPSGRSWSARPSRASPATRPSAPPASSAVPRPGPRSRS